MITSVNEIASLDGGGISLTRDQLDNLRSRAGGTLLTRDSDGWNEAIRIWNVMAANVPALVLQPTIARDVAACVEFARDHRLLLSIKGGGHNIAGTSIAENSVTLDLSRVRDIHVDPSARLAQVGAGCQLRDVDRATQAHGLATVLGFISEVGVAGLTLGGGLGYLTRRFGWTVDNLEEVEIVTADGKIRTASRTSNADLFWALRGGGGNFGVVTRFTYRLHPVGPAVYGGLIAWPFERVDEVLGTYRTLTGDAPRELAVWLILLEAPPAPFVPEEWQGRKICAMCVCYSGDLGQVEEVLTPIRALRNPVINLLHEQPYVEVQSYLDPTEPKGNNYYWKTEHLPGLNDEFLATIRDVFMDSPIPGGEVGVLHLSGALNERDADDGAVGNRDARYVAGVKAMWAPGEQDADICRRWVRQGWEKARRFGTGGNYINFQTADEGDERIRATYGANLQRLTAIKKQYDPDNMFRVNRNIRV